VVYVFKKKVFFLSSLLGLCENEEKVASQTLPSLGVRLRRLVIRVVAICLLFLVLQIMHNIVVADLRLLKDFKYLYF